MRWWRIVRRNGRGKERQSRASTNTKVGLRMRFLAACGVIERAASRPSSTVQSITPNATHSSQLHLSQNRFSITHRLPCKEAPFLLHRSHLHNRQHGFGGNYDCVRLACRPSDHLSVLTSSTVSTTARAAETATTYLRDGMPKQTLPT